MEEREVLNSISELKQQWQTRAKKMKDWYAMLKLVDTLETRNMESFVDNHPRTFFNTAHYLLTTGELTHSIAVPSDSPVEQDKRARIDRACKYLWKKIDTRLINGGSPSYISNVGFDMLLLGWFGTILTYNEETNLLDTAIWSPASTFPAYDDNYLTEVVYEYKIRQKALAVKAEKMGWNWKPRTIGSSENSSVSNYFVRIDDTTYGNMVMIDGKAVTPLVEREDIKILVAPIGGFPDRGSIDSSNDWTALYGQSILETNYQINLSKNKWMSFLMQILRDNAQQKFQEFSESPQATPEQLRERGSLFHFQPGEGGLQPVPQSAIPLELTGILNSFERQEQRGAFSDAVYGMIDSGMAGYALSQLTSTSANQILYPYMSAKHFIVAEADKFWLGKLKEHNITFEIKGKFLEELAPDDIPDDVELEVISDIATSKDWMERATISNMLDKHLDSDTIMTEIFKLPDTQSIKRKKIIDDMRNHPMTKNIEMISAYKRHADYLDLLGDFEQANTFRNAASALEAQLGSPPAGQAAPIDYNRVEASKEGKVPERRARVAPNVAPPETTSGFTPDQLRNMLGSGKVRGG